MDSILFWNEVALEANRVSHTNDAKEQTGPVLSARALAIVHLAMYDAFAAVPGSGVPAYWPIAAPAGVTVSGSVAGAAHAALTTLFPTQRSFFEGRLAAFAASGTSMEGYEFGVTVARRLLADREKDPGAETDGHVASPAPGKHRVDPDNPGQGFHAPFYGARSSCFAATQRHALDKPPYLAPAGGFDPAYLDAVDEVRRLGIAPELAGTLPQAAVRRATDQTIAGIYWAYDGAVGIGTPPRLYNQIVRRVAVKQDLTEAENARLFALVNACMADAGILAWEQKYVHDFWRPVVGIREHDTSMGPTAVGGMASDRTDAGWLPLGAPASNALDGRFRPQTSPHYPHVEMVPGRVKNFTPNFPAYPSGHATFGAAALHAVRLFLKTNKGDYSKDKYFDDLDFVSDELDGVTQDNKGTIRPRHARSFKEGLWGMIVENGLSRVYLGVHWVFDAFATKDGKPDLSKRIGGVRLGLDIAEDVVGSGMKHDKRACSKEPRAVPCGEMPPAAGPKAGPKISSARDRRDRGR